MRAPSQYVCSLDNQRTEAPSGRVSRTWRLATSISVTSFEPTLKTYTVSRLSAAPAAAADRTGAVLVSEARPPLPLELPAEGDVVGLDDPQAEASSPNAALLAPLRSARRSRLEERNQSEPPTNTPFASSREAQSSGAQCEGGLATDRGLMMAFDIMSLLQRPRFARAFSNAVEGRLHFQDRVDVAARGKARAHRVHREVGGSEVAPLPGPLRPLGRAADPIGEAS